MRVLVIHNAYQHYGGEDAVVAAEIELLRCHGHEVELYRRDNVDVEQLNPAQLVRDTVWSLRSYREIARVVKTFRPDVAHLHNSFPLISPSAYWALAAARVPVVQTLHNFRLQCLQAMLLRNNAVCEDCLGRQPWRGVVRRCYRDSATASAAVATMLTVHRALGSFQRKVTRYIALNEFTRRKFIEGGLPAERIVIKPNFVDLAAAPAQPRQGGLFVGRLSPEKGISVLLEALTHYPQASIDVIGTGPLGPVLSAHPQLRAKGWQQPQSIYEHMRHAAYLLLPSLWYENFPRTIVEAFACGLPVIASRLGAMAELIDEGRTGLLFDPGSASDLAYAMAWAEAHPEAMRQMGMNARAEYEAKFTPETNYRQLVAIYTAATEEVKTNGIGDGRRTAHGTTHTL